MLASRRSASAWPSPIRPAVSSSTVRLRLRAVAAVVPRPFELRQDRRRSPGHRLGHARQPRHVDAVAPVGRARHHPVQEHHPIAALQHLDLEARHPGQLVSQVGQLVVVGREQRLAAQLRIVVDLLHHRSRDGDPVERAGPAPDLVEHQQALGRRVPQDVRRLDHLDHERAALARQVVLRAHPREDAIHHAEPRRRGRHERPDLRQQDDQRDLPEVGRLASHVRPGQDRDRRVLGAQVGCRSA